MLDYRLKERDELFKNLAILRQTLEKGIIEDWLETKIFNFCETYDFEPELIKFKILTDDIFCVDFCKNPLKQSFHQSLAFKEIKSLKNVKNAILLPNRAEGSKYVLQGMVLPYSQAQNTIAGKTKSIDFEWKSEKSNGVIINCYATHKYTKNEGGGQDNQFKDIQNYLENARYHNGKDFFFAICDGEYYLKAFNGYNSRIEFLNSTHKGNRCIALTINELENYINNLS